VQSALREASDEIQQLKATIAALRDAVEKRRNAA
jgi:HAMP domain-containing protein